jgi:hypothetical protein
MACILLLSQTRWDALIRSDPLDMQTHGCRLANGFGILEYRLYALDIGAVCISPRTHSC